MTIEYVEIFFQVIVFLFAISVHESAHAWMAWRCGDPTAHDLGRVSLNPIRHIDPIGTVILPLLALLYHFPMIGWAKPTPVDPRNFRNPVRDDIMTSVMGPISNMLVASGAVFGLLLIRASSPEGRLIVISLAARMPVDTGSVLVPLAVLLYEAMFINVLLAVFNLIPVPPLDGSHVLRHMLPEGARMIYDRVGMFGLVIIFLVGGRIIAVLMSPFLAFFNNLLIRI